MIHPARTIPFAQLRGQLQAANDNGLVSRQTDGDLELYTYTKACVYQGGWTPYTKMARGLVLDAANDNVVATPFPKFFNVYEEQKPIPDLSFETFEKADGSLIIIFWHAGQWRTATKGSFKSVQAVSAAELLAGAPTGRLIQGCTYLCEYVGPDNRIVLHYPKSELVLLGAYDHSGKEATWGVLADLAHAMGWRLAERREFASFAELLATKEALPGTAEGFVVRFSNGYRLKVKGDEYCRLHRLVSNVTPLAIWEAMKSGSDLEAVRRELPEEFWSDFDGIVSKLDAAQGELTNRAFYIHDKFEGMSDKEVGLALPALKDDIRHLIFPLRKHGLAKLRELVLKAIRPTNNILEAV